MPAVHVHATRSRAAPTAAYRRHVRNGEPALPPLPAKPKRPAGARESRAPKPAPRRRAARSAAASEATGWQPGFVVDVFGLLDYCEAIVPGWDREAAMGADF